jgi:hypothetical protein
MPLAPFVTQDQNVALLDKNATITDRLERETADGIEFGGHLPGQR